MLAVVTRKASERSPLVDAAQALADEIEVLRSLVAATTREKLESARSLERAAVALQEIPEAEARIRDRLLSLAAAFEGARQLQEALAQQTHKRTEEISARAAKLQALVAAQAALGEETRELNRAVQELAGSPPAQVLAQLDPGIARIVEQASELSVHARQSGFGDLARASDALRQQVLALKNRIALNHPGPTRPAADERA
jgi:chromosome segregation ATPase